jgi:hypothetical protein
VPCIRLKNRPLSNEKKQSLIKLEGLEILERDTICFTGRRRSVRAVLPGDFLAVVLVTVVFGFIVNCSESAKALLSPVTLLICIVYFSLLNHPLIEDLL